MAAADEVILSLRDPTAGGGRGTQAPGAAGVAFAQGISSAVQELWSPAYNEVHSARNRAFGKHVAQADEQSW